MKPAKRAVQQKGPAKDEAAEKQRRERALEEGLEETFPASDAVAVTEPVAEHPPDSDNKSS
jgi:hypothetical protein